MCMCRDIFQQLLHNEVHTSLYFTWSPFPLVASAANALPPLHKESKMLQGSWRRCRESWGRETRRRC